MQAIDLTGMTFGYLTVIKRVENSNAGKARWLCRCKCGRETVVVGCQLRDGRIVSCGCYSAQNARNRLFRHGGCKTKLYNIWSSMKERCESASCSHYIFYGAKGVRVCPEWRDFGRFKAWAMENGYVEGAGLSIDRIDNEGDYEPSNCQWIPLSENVVKRNRLPEKLRERIKQYMLEGKTDSEIVRLVGVSREGVRPIRAEIGAPTRHEKTVALYAKVKSLLEDGYTVRDVANTLNMIEGTVYSIRAKLGLSKTKIRIDGKDNHYE